MKNWTEKDRLNALKIGFALRPFRYIAEDGCWTIVRPSQSKIESREAAISLVLRLGACRDLCKNESQFQTCQKAAKLAMGADSKI